MDPITIRALQVMPTALAATYIDLWREENDLDGITRLIHETARSFERDRQERPTEPAHVETPVNAPIHTEPSVAITASKRALMKGIRNIEEYNSHIKDDAARKYLRDCERYFREIAQFTGMEPEDYDKVIRASGALKGHAASQWKRQEERIAATDPDQAVRTFAAYQNWIEREFSEHLGEEKRWDCFQKCRQKDRSFADYVSDLRIAAAECGIEVPEPMLIQFLRKGANVPLQKRWAEDREKPMRLTEVIERFIQYEQGAMIAGYLHRKNDNNRGNHHPDAMDLDTMAPNGSKQNKSSKKQNQGGRNPNCFNCGKPGHIARYCPSPKDKNASETSKYNTRYVTV